ncbi:hypothetical protein LV89_01354 [Arcicella aurantiaca]|uniref:Fibronectin type-III domain-containing protein n=1 Tax=Arcicella aurantiaca TaxID=591202 RepID=A0A316EGT1_9BACT|nr:fibronectin type III domain-containing protein [Arcicella aurantiaca]PWK27947.1 hypothetical protein LV89_01354 [Arcicella aurantiaca]
MNITTKTNQLVLALIVSFFSILMACKSKEEPAPINQPPGNFNITSTLSTNGQDVILKWTKSKDPDGDIVTYSVVYNDTLTRNLSDTTYTIKNLPFETEIKGSVVAKDTKGSKTVSNFNVKTGADYVLIPDANFEKWLIALKIDDVSDGKVLKSSVLKVTSLNVSDTSNDNIDPINSLTGIEAFINLETLWFSKNLVKSIDISKNIALSSIRCWSNQLTSLDISKNIKLTDLYCFENQLSQLDISQNTALILVQIDKNKLTTLDVSKNIALAGLTCQGNQLTTLDMSKNINLQLLRCNNNQLKNLDVSKNTNLTILDCFTNKLSSIDISKNNKLIELYCHENLITNLDLTQNTLLEILLCNNNSLNELDIKKNLKVTSLFCNNNKIQTICVNNLSQVKTTWQKDLTATYKVCP